MIEEERGSSPGGGTFGRTESGMATEVGRDNWRVCRFVGTSLTARYALS